MTSGLCTIQPTGLSADERALCSACAHWLSACVRTVSAVGLGAAALALLALALRPALPWAALAVLVLLPAERVLALRLRFDAGLFADLAEGRLDLPALDAALAALRLRRAAALPRALPERVAGARRLVLQHALLVLLQAAALLAALSLAPWPALPGAAG